MIPVLVYGDSNSHGTKPLVTLGKLERYKRTDRWPDVMARSLPNCDIVVDGVPGRTTGMDDPVMGPHVNGLTTIQSSIAAHAPRVLVIMLGTNDLKAHFGGTPESICTGLETLVLQAKMLEGYQDLEIFLISPANVRQAGVLTLRFSDAHQRQVGLANAVQSLAGKLDAGFFDAASVMTASAQDGVHFEVEEHHKMGKAMAKSLDDWLKTRGLL